MTPLLNHEAWLGTFRELLRHYMPDVPNSPLANVASLVAVAAGLFLVFRSWKFERFVVSFAGLIVGAWIGQAISQLVHTPAPISAAVGGVAMTVVAYHSYRWWLAGGSVLVLFGIAMVFQLGRGDLQRYLPDPTEHNRSIKGDLITGLPSAEEMARNLNPGWADQFSKMKEPVLRELKALGPVGWLIPVAAAILGGLLAYWVLRAFSVVWLGFLGAGMVLLGVASFTCAHWPNARTWLISAPQ